MSCLHSKLKFTQKKFKKFSDEHFFTLSIIAANKAAELSNSTKNLNIFGHTSGSLRRNKKANK